MLRGPGNKGRFVIPLLDTFQGPVFHSVKTKLVVRPIDLASVDLIYTSSTGLTSSKDDHPLSLNHRSAPLSGPTLQQGWSPAIPEHTRPAPPSDCKCSASQCPHPGMTPALAVGRTCACFHPQNVPEVLGRCSVIALRRVRLCLSATHLTAFLSVVCFE